MERERKEDGKEKKEGRGRKRWRGRRKERIGDWTGIPILLGVVDCGSSFQPQIKKYKQVQSHSYTCQLAAANTWCIIG